MSVTLERSVADTVSEREDLVRVGKDAEIGQSTDLCQPDVDDTEDTGVTLRHWTRDEYHKATELGIFAPDEHLELINGVIYQKIPEKPAHMTMVKLINAELLAAFAGRNARISGQHAVVLPTESEPEPDVAVIAGGIRDYEDRHPTAAETLLLVEASNTTLSFDRNTKKRAYAAAGIADYWIVNLAKRCVEVYRDPQDGVYRDVTVVQDTDFVSPLAAPDKRILVSDFLPRKVEPAGAASHDETALSSEKS